MKKILLMLIMITITISFVGCSKDNKKVETSEDVIKEEKEFEKDDNDKKQNNELLLIAYVNDENKEETIKEFFSSASEAYDNLDTVNNGSSYEFVIIPKYDDAKINVYEAELKDDGKIVRGDEIAKNKKGTFKLTTAEFEYVPNVIVAYEDDDVNFEQSITFSGEDGRLVIDEVNKKYIKDVTIY